MLFSFPGRDIGKPRMTDGGAVNCRAKVSATGGRCSEPEGWEETGRIATRPPCREPVDHVSSGGVVGSSPAWGARMNNLSSLGLRGYFFAFSGSNFTKNRLLVSILR